MFNFKIEKNNDMNNINLCLILSILLTFNFKSSVYPQEVSEKYLNAWSDVEIEDRIHTGIETHRKGWAEISFISFEGKPVEFTGEIIIKQESHDFLFGASIFMLNGYKEESKNDAYELVFKELLNFATVPFYWKTLEPEKGKPRFEKDSKFIYRRPPPDRVVEFCKKNDVVMKGHPVFWDHPGFAIPEWWPQNADSTELLLEDRVKELAKRYSNDILFWDAVNEANNRKTWIPAPENFPLYTFQLCNQYFKSTNSFAYNFTTHIWRDSRGKYSHEYVLTENLLLKGGKPDAIGLQLHLMGKKLWNEVLNGQEMTPDKLYKVLDLYADFNLPLQITEITFPALPEGDIGEENQARVTKDFYRLLFSHPNVEAITWWNVSDGGAAKNQNRWLGGFLREDLSRKPSCNVLHELINHEWKTKLNVDLKSEHNYKFKGFYGHYDIILKEDGKIIGKEHVELKKSKDNQFLIEIR